MQKCEYPLKKGWQNSTNKPTRLKKWVLVNEGETREKWLVQRQRNKASTGQRGEKQAACGRTKTKISI